MAIYRKFYTDSKGYHYCVSLDYEKDASPRGYYLNIAPCEIDASEDYFCYTVTIDRRFFQESVRSCILSVKRASQKAVENALELMESAVDIYFAPRGVIRIESAADICHRELVGIQHAD